MSQNADVVSLWKYLSYVINVNRLNYLYINNAGIKCYTLPEFPDDFSQLEAVIPGPKGSPYEDGLFKLSIQFGDQYPFRPPTFKFLTPVYHPNIDNCKFYNQQL